MISVSDGLFGQTENDADTLKIGLEKVNLSANQFMKLCEEFTKNAEEAVFGVIDATFTCSELAKILEKMGLKREDFLRSIIVTVCSHVLRRSFGDEKSVRYKTLVKCAMLNMGLINEHEPN